MLKPLGNIIGNIMRTLLLIVSLSFVYSLTTGCSSTAPGPGPGSSKGKEINDCMAKNTPEECDRQVNRRRTTY